MSMYMSRLRMHLRQGTAAMAMAVHGWNNTHIAKKEKEVAFSRAVVPFIAWQGLFPRTTLVIYYISVACVVLGYVVSLQELRSSNEAYTPTHHRPKPLEPHRVCVCARAGGRKVPGCALESALDH